MPSTIDSVLLRAGDTIRFEDRDDLLAKLDRLDQRIPSRKEGRTKDQREHFCIVRYLQVLAGSSADLLPLPVTLRKERRDPPDFTLEWEGGRETIELTDGSTREFQQTHSRDDPADELPLPIDIDTPEREASQWWAEVLFAAYLKKARQLEQGRFDVDHLLIYDLTGINFLVPFSEGGRFLKARISRWEKNQRPSHSFRRVSVLRDQALLLDVTSSFRVLEGESPFFQLPVVWAKNEEDLRRRLRELDRYCRDNSILHLKIFGSTLGDVGAEFELERSDLDLLVEFQPGARISLFDMARMERELGELIGLKIDLRTPAELSRHFRDEVVEGAVRLDAATA